MAIKRINWRLVPVASVALYLAAQYFGWNLLADPTDGRGWFFNPFTWQLLFLTGFGLGQGWLAPPPRTKWLQVPAIAMLLFGLCAEVAPIYQAVPWLRVVHGWTVDPMFKTMLHPLEYFYFLALAYLAIPVFSRRLGWFQTLPGSIFVIAGRQSLAVFLATVVLADLGGVVFDVMGKGVTMQVMVNLGGFMALAVLAILVNWYKSSPWKAKRTPAPPPEPAPPFLSSPLVAD